MRAVNIGDLKNNLSRYLNEVRRGSGLVIQDRSKPIARIIPLEPIGDDDAELVELIAEGTVRPPRSTGAFPRSFWSEQLPASSLDLSDIVREDRDAR